MSQEEAENKDLEEKYIEEEDEDFDPESSMYWHRFFSV